MTNRPPDGISKVLSEITKDPAMNDAVMAMMDRSTEFSSPLAAKLTGIALNPTAALHFGDKLDEMWSKATLPRETSEVIIGGGLHAAVYCSVRVAQGHPKPLVIEAKDRAGGTFAVSRRPSFYLNSRNRPGKLGTPGRAEALNYLPGAPVQPSDLGGDEYQRNSDLAFAIRAALAMNAKVVTGKRVESADSRGVVLSDGTKIKATRVIYATGLGTEKAPQETDGERLMTYLQFLSHLDKPFPFQGIDRVAVVGAQDAGRTVIEALTGQGPASQWSVAALDYIDKIDWYGVSPSCLTKEQWRNNNRSRYQGIARLLPREITGEGKAIGEGSRVNPLTRKAEDIGVGFDGAYVDGARYDLVIWAAGFEAMDVDQMIEYRTGGRVVARMAESGVFVVGPAAQISDTREANVPDTVPENSAAAFRYTDRTAALAMSLPAWALPTGDAAEPQVASVAVPPTKKRRPSAATKLAKQDPINWAVGDKIEFVDGSKTAIVKENDEGSIKIEKESDGSGPRYIGAGNWRFVG